MFTHEEIWRAIERLAERNGLSTSGLAKKAGLDATTFNRSKRISPEGKPRWPSTESLSRILAVTNTTMSDFLSFLKNNKGNNGGLSPKERALETAKILLDTRSILFNAQQPFTYTSGRVGPVYIDCRRLISFPEERSRLMDLGADMLTNEIDDPIDMLAGGETAGIPYAAFLSERMNKPMLYVRKKPKGFGRMAQIEGHMDKDGKNVILIEDLQTDGGSKKIFVDALRQAGATINHAFVIFHYGIFAASEKNMKDMGITLHALTTWWDVLDIARQEKYFDVATLQSVEDFLKDPVGWSVKHGGRGDVTESA